MNSLILLPFQPIDSTAPAFNSTLGSSGSYALESTGTRDWRLPASRAVRVAGRASTPYYILFGSSAVSASTATSVLIPSGAAHVVPVPPGTKTYIGIASSTDVVVNVTLGYGG